MKIIIALMISFSLFLCTLIAHQQDVVKNNGIIETIHKNHCGEITFMSQVIPLDKFTETDFLKVCNLDTQKDLNIRVFMANSLTNYLHLLAPDFTVDELVNSGNFQFTFWVDSVLVYQENLVTGAGNKENKNTATVFRVPLISSTNEDSWGCFLWNRFLMNGGNDALTDETHQLSIEIRPYLTKDKVIKTGDIIAKGSITLIVPPKKINEKLVQIQKIDPSNDWEVSDELVDSNIIMGLNKKIALNQFKDITSIIMVKNGKLLVEEYFNKANRKTLHDTRSVGKSFASALIGIAIDQGFLKSEMQTLNEFYSLKNYPNYSIEKENITIKHLLTMSSAFEGSDSNLESLGNEENMYMSKNWLDFTLSLPLDNQKTNGIQWDYLSAGTILLGDILNKQVTGGLKSFADNQLFKPLGIKRYKWQFTPQKTPNTAGSLQMASLDFAKFGWLYKNKGYWKDKTIISEDWINKSLNHQIPIPGSDNEFYGYLFWNKTIMVNNCSYEIYYASGNGGNQIIIFKDYPVVIVLTAKAFNAPYALQQSNKILKEYLIPALKLNP